MRAFAAAFLICVPGLAAAASIQPNHQPGPSSASQCQRTTNYLAGKRGGYRGQGLTPRKLDELPPATAYMAVYRHIDGCEAPLTMVDYRNPTRR